jgi:Domain of unknown function (DUF4760)
MSAINLSTVSTVLTLIIIAGTAVAAMVQMRHLRRANELQGLLTVLVRVEDMALQEWLIGTQRIVREQMADPAYRISIADGTYDRANNPWVQMANSYEWVGSLVRHGLIPEGPVLDVYRARVIRAWETMECIIAVRRRNGDTRVFENFEYLYMRAKTQQKALAHRITFFPHGTPHARLRDPWAGEDGSAN